MDTKNGTFWFCGEHPSCHFICSDEKLYLYDKAIQVFLAYNQERPKCCAVGEDYEERNFAKIGVVTDDKKENFGRPFFTCSKKDKRCGYFEWGDETIIPKPLCMHLKPCEIRKVKKEGPNHGRKFLCCPEPAEERCEYFRWFNANGSNVLSKHDVPTWGGKPAYCSRPK